jgi:hypothetical protein
LILDNVAEFILNLRSRNGVQVPGVFRPFYEHTGRYPGHSSAPDFLKFEADPYALFEKNLPRMHAF